MSAPGTKSYDGGKGGAGVWQAIINQIPPHRTLIIPFGGHCAITRKMRPCETTYLIEREISALQLWRGDERPGLKLIHGDAFQLLPAFEQMGLLASHDTLIYADPPYVLTSRRSSRAIYKHELTDDDHQQLLVILTRLKCRVAVSGYHHAIYAEALKGWRRITSTATTRSGHAATEVLWMNYPAPTELHDDRWLDFGRGWRERDRIKKKVARLQRKLRELPPLERRRLLAAALAECGDGRSPHAEVEEVGLPAPLAGNGDSAGRAHLAKSGAIVEHDVSGVVITRSATAESVEGGSRKKVRSAVHGKTGERPPARAKAKTARVDQR